MEKQDTLDRTAHIFGMTDVEFEKQSRIESEIAAQQIIRQRMLEDQDRQALKNFPNSGEDFDFGFHDQFDS